MDTTVPEECIYQNTRRHIPEGRNLDIQHGTSLKCHTLAKTLWLQILYSIIYDGKHDTVVTVVPATRCFYDIEQL
jgi:hypothetical protein